MDGVWTVDTDFGGRTVMVTRRVGGSLFLISASLFVTLGLWTYPAEAQEEAAAMATLDGARIELRPGPDGVNVVESIEVSGLDALEQKEIEHVVSRPQRDGIEDLTISAGGRDLSFDRTEGEVLDRVLVTLPENASDGFEYEISYRYPGVEENKVPLVVPAVSSGEVANNVSLQMEIPEGEYLQSSFPRLRAGEGGTFDAGMVGVPSYVSFVLGSSPAGPFTSANLYTALTFIVIVGCVGGLLLFERRSRTRNSSGEVAGV